MPRRSAMLRFSDEQFAQYSESREARRERFNAGRVSVPEREILAASLELLRKHPRVAFARRNNTGAGFLLYRDTYERLVRAGHLKASEARYQTYGIKDGGDVIGMLIGGQLLNVECKSDRGRLSDGQEAFGQAVANGGGLWIVNRSVDELVHLLADV